MSKSDCSFSLGVLGSRIDAFCFLIDGPTKESTIYKSKWWTKRFNSSYWLNHRADIKEKMINTIIVMFRGWFRATTKSEMKRFVTTVNGWNPLTFVTQSTILLDIPEVLDPPMILSLICIIYPYLEKVGIHS